MANGTLYSWGKFMSDEEIGLNSEVSGSLGSYKNGGYVLKIGRDGTTLLEAQSNMAHFGEFIRPNTLAFNFVMGGYILDIDYFFSVDLLLERTPTGGYQPVVKNYDLFRPTLSWNYSYNLYGDLLVYLLTVIQLSVNIKTVASTL